MAEKVYIVFEQYECDDHYAPHDTILGVYKCMNNAIAFARSCHDQAAKRTWTQESGLICHFVDARGYCDTGCGKNTPQWVFSVDKNGHETSVDDSPV